MTIVRVQRISMPKSGQVKDQTVNTFYFDHIGVPDAAACIALCGKLDEFFNLAVAAGNAVRYFIAESEHATQRTVYKVYDMDDVSPRVPIAMPPAQNVTPVITTSPLPSEVAICLSFRGALISGVNMARRRGRVFIGPLNINAMTIDATTGKAVPVTALQTALTAGANRMKDDLAGTFTWGIYSPTTRGGGAASTGFTLATDAWVDNAFDTQRRRGGAPTSRVTITL